MHKCAISEIEKEEGEYVERLPKDKYGPNFTAFSIFLFIELAIPQEAVMHIFNNVFKLRLASGQLAPVKRKASLFIKRPTKNCSKKYVTEGCFMLMKRGHTRIARAIEAYPVHPREPTDWEAHPQTDQAKPLRGDASGGRPKAADRSSRDSVQ